MVWVGGTVVAHEKWIPRIDIGDIDSFLPQDDGYFLRERGGIAYFLQETGKGGIEYLNIWVDLLEENCELYLCEKALVLVLGFSRVKENLIKVMIYMLNTWSGCKFICK